MIEPFLYSAFVSTCLIFLGLYLREHSIISHVLQGVGAMILFFQVPLIYVFASNKQKRSNSYISFRQLIFHVFSGFFFCVAGVIFFGVLFGWWEWIHAGDTTSVITDSVPLKFGTKEHIIHSYYAVVGFVPSLTACGILANVLMISGFFADTGLGLKLKHFLSMNLLLIIAAATLGIIAEFTYMRKGNPYLALLEGILAGLLFVAGLFNTHGLGGRLLHAVEDSNCADTEAMAKKSIKMKKQELHPKRVNEDSWYFFQPFVGGARFVFLQATTWILLAIALAFEIIFIASAFVYGFQMFIGLSVLAGACCIIAEVLMIVSLFVFQKPNQSQVQTEVDKISGVSQGQGVSSIEFYVKRLENLLAIILFTNIGYVTAIGMFPVFAVSGLSYEDLFVQWGSAVVSIFLFPVVFAYCRAK